MTLADDVDDIQKVCDARLAREPDPDDGSTDDVADDATVADLSIKLDAVLAMLEKIAEHLCQSDAAR